MPSSLRSSGVAREPPLRVAAVPGDGDGPPLAGPDADGQVRIAALRP